jgi:hypothetical protein
MDSDAIKEVLDVLFSNLEKLETQTEGIRQFLKEKKKVTDAQLAPYLEQAGKASNVRWRAARVRIEYLIAGAEREQEKEQEGAHKKTTEGAQSEAVETAAPGPWAHGAAGGERAAEEEKKDDNEERAPAEKKMKNDENAGHGSGADEVREAASKESLEPSEREEKGDDREAA